VLFSRESLLYPVVAGGVSMSPLCHAVGGPSQVDKTVAISILRKTGEKKTGSNREKVLMSKPALRTLLGLAVTLLSLSAVAPLQAQTCTANIPRL
jgi:hypothetical protein